MACPHAATTSLSKAISPTPQITSDKDGDEDKDKEEELPLHFPFLLSSLTWFCPALPLLVLHEFVNYCLFSLLSSLLICLLLFLLLTCTFHSLLSLSYFCLVC